MRAVPPARVVLWLAIVGWAALFSYLSILRHHAFWSGRFDLGNMVQAVWSTAQGRPLETTDVAGRQFVRLGAHVDPVLVLFTPLTWTGHLPEALLIAQSLIVALGALPAYWLARRYLGSERAGLVGAGVYLLYPPLQWAVLTEFHPVALAAPALMFCIWAIQEHRFITLIPFAVFAALTKEQVGLALAMLGIWCALRHSRRVGLIVAASGTAWTALCMLVIIPHFNDGRGSSFAGRYAHLGDGPGAWAEALTGPGRIAYLAALLLPLALLPLGAPLLALAAAPELAINMLAEWYPQYSYRYQYVAVVVPILVAAAVIGAGRIAPWLRQRGESLGRAAGLWIVWLVVAGVAMGPLPWWSSIPGGSTARADTFGAGPHAQTLSEAVDLIPDGAEVSAGNLLGAHLSERRRIHFFPHLGEAEWVIVDQHRPYIFGSMLPTEHARQVAQLVADPRFEVVFNRGGVVVARRVVRS